MFYILSFVTSFTGSYGTRNKLQLQLQLQLHETVQSFLCQESSPKSSVNPEVNQSEAGPEIADDTQLYNRDGKL
jgi:hypothetical protein